MARRLKMAKQARHGSKVSRRQDSSIKKLVVNILRSFAGKAGDVIASSIGPVGTLILWLSPIACTAAGAYAYAQRGYSAVGGEVFLAVMLPALGFFLRSVASARDNFESGMPVPRRRFTEEYEDGRVDVDYDRLQEMVLYVADIEDWLDAHGYTYSQRH